MKSARRSLAGCAASVAVLGVALAVTVTVPAQAAPKAPSWDDVKAAKASASATERQVDALSTRLGTLQDRADAASVAEQQAGQAYSLAASKQEDAQADLDDLRKQAKRAKSAADESAGQVAGLVVELSRTGGGDLSTSMLVDSKDAKDLLYQVGTMSHLSERSAGVLARAQADQRTVDSLADQADAATTALAKATTATKTAYATANDVAAAAQDRLTTEQSQQQTVLEQLAYLKGTTAATEAAYWNAQRAEDAETELASSTGSRSTTTASGGTASGGTSTDTAGSTGGSTAPSSGGTTPTSGGTTPSTQPSTKPTTPTTTPTTPTTPTKPAPTTPAPAPSTPSYAAGAIAYARAQIGDPYVFGGAGPNQWDCSGLVMMAYNSVGVATGGHNVVWQYNHFKSIGRLVPLAQRQAGDILFYSSNGSVSGAYHDSIYTGGGMMVEAAKPGVGVVERYVWTPNQLLPYVARPTGAL